MNQAYLLTPTRGSHSGSGLAKGLGILKLNTRRLNKFVGDPTKLVINWGNSELPEEVAKCQIINSPVAVGKAVNKWTALVEMQDSGVSVPAFTDSERTARHWVVQGHVVVARHKLNGSGGEGIELLSTEDDFPCKAPLYTLYIPKKSEWRLHILNGNLFDLQRKMRRRDMPDDKINWKIRNHDNGFIFGRDGEQMEKEVFNSAYKNSKLALEALGLDFGAVDLIYNEKQKKAYVLEVNTAPGLEGTTLENYISHFWERVHKPNGRVNAEAAQGYVNVFGKRIAEFRDHLDDGANPPKLNAHQRHVAEEKLKFDDFLKGFKVIQN